ncbi:PTS sugar transporter subunit IIB [Oscillospiraceae bacterium PP1C4]
MNIVLSRVDERLVHGQVIASWTKYLAIKRIIIIDDQLASDSFMSQVLSMAAPAGITVEIVTAEKAAEKIAGNLTDGEKTMLLFKSLKYALALMELGVELQELNIGNIGAGPSRKAISKNVFASSAEVDIIKQLQEKGVFVYLQMVYSEAKVDLKSKI